MEIRRIVIFSVVIFINICQLYSCQNSKKENANCEFIPYPNEHIKKMTNSEFDSYLTQFALHCDKTLQTNKGQNKKIIKININFAGNEESSISSSLVTNHGTLKNKNKTNKKKKNKKVQKEGNKSVRDEFDDPEVKKIIAQIERDRILFASGRKSCSTQKNNTYDDNDDSDTRTLLEKLRDKIFFKQYSRFSDKSRERIRENIGCDSDDNDSYERDCDCDECKRLRMREEDLDKIDVTKIYISKTAPNPDHIAYLSVAFQPVKKPTELLERRSSGLISYKYLNKDMKFFYGKRIFEDACGDIYLVKNDICEQAEHQEELVKILNIIPRFCDEITL